MIGINRKQNQTVVVNNYYGNQGMGGCMGGGGPMGMGGMGGQMNPMQMMMQMMQMMMKMMMMMMGGNSSQCMQGQFPGMMGGMPGMMGGMPGMMGGMPGMMGGMPGMMGGMPMGMGMGNCIGNFMGMPGGGGAGAYAGPGGAGAYAGGTGAYAGPGGAGAYTGGTGATGGAPISGSGSGVDAVNMARRFLGRNSRDIKGELPHFTAAGGQTNNCADFVSSCLESQGLLKGHHVGVSNGNLRRALLSQGYKRIPASQARAGDVWISNSGGHTELVQGVQNGKLKLIGSNNDRPGHQVISEATKSLNSGVIYGRR